MPTIFRVATGSLMATTAIRARGIPAWASTPSWLHHQISTGSPSLPGFHDKVGIELDDGIRDAGPAGSPGKVPAGNPIPDDDQVIVLLADELPVIVNTARPLCNMGEAGNTAEPSGNRLANTDHKRRSGHGDEGNDEEGLVGFKGEDTGINPLWAMMNENSPTCASASPVITAVLSG